MEISSLEPPPSLYKRITASGKEIALPGALAAGREKGGELATTSLDFENVPPKRRYRMLKAEMTRGFNVCLHSC